MLVQLAVDSVAIKSLVLSGFFFGGLGMQELLIVAVVAVLLFGKNLPSVARSLGRSYNEFKKGVNDISSEFRNATNDVESSITSNSYSSETSDYQSSYDDYDDYEEATAPKFDPPPADPVDPPSTNA